MWATDAHPRRDTLPHQHQFTIIYKSNHQKTVLDELEIAIWEDPKLNMNNFQSVNLLEKDLMLQNQNRRKILTLQEHGIIFNDKTM